MQNIADAMPALGIVAAVLGVIKTIGSIDQPPAVLGKMIGGALVGTFLGVLLAYGLMGPMARQMKAVVKVETKFHKVIRAVLVAHPHGNAPQVAVETGRKMAPSHSMPSFRNSRRASRAYDLAKSLLPPQRCPGRPYRERLLAEIEDRLVEVLSQVALRQGMASAAEVEETIGGGGAHCPAPLTPPC